MMRLPRAELLKQLTTRTVLGLSSAMLGLIVLAVLLHGFGLPAEQLADPSRQLRVLGLGELLGTLFGALLGALSITAEIRHGTIRPTFLVTPWRRRVVAAKVSVSVLIGAAFGVIGGAVAAAIGAAALQGRGIDVLLDGGDYALLVAGATGATALWAGIGVGIGALVRNQVPTVVGLCAWLLFVEGLLADATGGLGEVGRYLPGAAAAAMSGQAPDTLLAPAVGLVLLVSYAVVTTLAGAVATSRRDVG
jgi:ABC-type transport system involved in multi-copper enzyme maturation permease subunit